MASVKVENLFHSSLKSDDNRAISKGALKCYCISCRAQHKQVSCPKCGSKLQRIEIL
jgi:Zn finger protein HypA/HybF involved in hydrogenase expression